MLDVNSRQELFCGFILCHEESDRWRFRRLVHVFPQSCIFWAELLSFSHYIDEIFKAFAVTVGSDWPAVLRPGVEALPEERVGEGDRDETASRLQAATNLAEERRVQDGITTNIQIINMYLET